MILIVSSGVVDETLLDVLRKDGRQDGLRSGHGGGRLEMLMEPNGNQQAGQKDEHAANDDDDDVRVVRRGHNGDGPRTVGHAYFRIVHAGSDRLEYAIVFDFLVILNFGDAISMETSAPPMKTGGASVWVAS